MSKILTIVIGLFTITLSGQEIKLSPAAKVSVVTCGPGEPLYSAFGHSAFRVEDPVLGIDQAYNYGTFNFDTPNFYVKFARGKLLYDLSSYPFHYFYKEYKSDNRWVKEDILNLSPSETQRFFEFLQNNAKPENRSYLYDFFFDNCATKLPEVSHKILKDTVKLNYNFADNQHYTFRQLLHLYLTNHPWGKFGIDLALGSVIDRKATPQEYLFLPDYVSKAYENGTINSEPLVTKSQMLIPSVKEVRNSTIFTPLLLFFILALLVVIITIRDLKQHKRSKWLDAFLFLITGLPGLVILLLWFATDHTATANNFNALWAFAPNLIFVVTLFKEELPHFLKYWLILLLGLLAVTVLLWIIKIQIFPIAIIPLLVLLAIRYIYLYRVSN